MEALFERVFVETTVDTDQDGQYDLIAVYIKRPKLDEKVPAVFVANPYMLHCNEDWYDLYDVNTDIQAYPSQNIQCEDITFHPKDPVVCPKKEAEQIVESSPYPEPDPSAYECISDLYDHLLERGYAGVFSGGLGTRGSDGLTMTGSEEEILAFKSVIDWLNGRARAFRDKTRTVQVLASWCTGSVAMSARSYLGTMCIGVATTGVEGLKTILPEAGISNWYEYYRHNGLTLPAMDWQGDDLDILAKYCFSRALDSNDFASIKPLFEKLQELGKDRMMLLHQGQHIYTYHLEDSPTLGLIDRWLDYYLKGIDTGIQNESKIYIENNLDQKLWMQEEVWPPKSYKSYRVQENGNQMIVDDLSQTIYDRKQKNTKAWLDELVLTQNAHSLSFDLETMKEDTRFAGRAKVSFRARIQQPTAILSAMLVEKGKQVRLTSNLDGDENHSFVFKMEEKPSDYFVITRGWMNAQNRLNNYSKEAIDPDTWYTYSFDFVSNDYTIPKGHTLSLILYGMDVDQTQLPFVTTEIEVDTASIVCDCPIE